MIRNDVVLNQVLLRFEDDAATSAALAAIHRDGDVYPSHTTWRGRQAIRISVSN